MSGLLIGVDTNILLRLFVVDDTHQHRAAIAFFEQCSSDTPVFVNSVVLAEFAWVLRRSFGYSKSQTIDAVSYLSASPDVEFQDNEAVIYALGLCEQSGEEFSDVFIAAINHVHQASVTLTFDKRAAKAVPTMELLT